MSNPSANIDAETVRYVAHLSRVDLSDEELELFAGQLAEIVGYIDKLDRLDTENVEPLAQAVEIPSVLREDARRPSLDVSKALSNAPEKTGDFYKVPAVLEG